MARYPLITSAICLALGLPCAGMAADTAATGDESGGELGEIVVTANRREENVLDVPYNISTVSGSALSNAGITDLSDVGRLLPGVSIPDLGPRANSSNSLIIIRGLNVNNPVNSAYLPWGSVPTVSTYIDDVPLYVNLKLDDIQRIEVLRGPQGTLYGSGAVGGTVKILHNAPDPSGFAAEFSADGSHTDHAENMSYHARGMINVPLGETAALRVSAGYEYDAGFINDPKAVVFTANQQPALADPADPLTSGLVYEPVKHIDDAFDFHLRAALKWKPLDWLDAELAYQRQDDHSNGFESQTEGYRYETLALVPQQPEHRTVDLDSLTVSVDAGFATLTSSSSYSIMSVNNVYDESQFIIAYNLEDPLLYGNYPRITSLFFDVSRDESFTQEFRLVSKEGGAWDYTAGAFLQHQTQHLLQTETVPGFGAWTQLPGSAAVVPPSTPGGPYANFGDYIQYYNGGTRPSQDRPTDTIFTYLRLSGFTDRALYGELTRHLTPQWQITAGARVFWQRFDQSLDSTIPDGGPLYSTLPYPENLTDHFGTTIVQREQSFSNHIFKLNSSYAITPDTRAYITYSQGFRHGGINALPIGACIFCESESIVPYRSDTVDNYEIGLKGTSGGWLRYSVAGYVEQWNDIQIQAFGQAGDPAVVNGKTARTEGIEAEATAQLSREWSASLGYGFTDAKLTANFSVLDPVNGATYVIVTGNEGDRLPYVPRQTLTGDLGYVHALGGSLMLDAHADIAYRSSVTTQLNSSVLGYEVLGGFTTMNASVGLRFDTGWHARLFVDNLTNVAGITSAGPLLRIYDDPRYRVQNVMRPRTIGLGIDYQFK